MSVSPLTRDVAPPRRRRWGAWILRGVLAFAVLLVVAVGWAVWVIFGEQSGSGDPGNARLHALEHAGLLMALPPQSQWVRERRYPAIVAPIVQNYGPLVAEPAQWDQAYHVWSHLDVFGSFRSSLTYGQVIAFYDETATRSGWKLTSNDLQLATTTWTKRLPEGYTATVTLTDDGRMPRLSQRNPDGYSLYGHIPPDGPTG